MKKCIYVNVIENGNTKKVQNNEADRKKKRKRSKNG